MEKMQVVQNQALRIATGCHRKSPIQHLHHEAKMMRVSPHTNLLCSQFLASALRSHHPSHAIVRQPSGPRQMKHTLYSRFGGVVAPFLQDGVMPPGEYGSCLKSLHTDAVSKEIDDLNRMGPNKVLGVPPPLQISKSELKLLRPHRCLLSQLRSGYSSSLRSYLHGIGKVDNANCPECDVAPHDTSHLFNCASFPTNLSAIDLWNNPVAVIRFLSSLPSFSSLPPLPPPPPEPPP